MTRLIALIPARGGSKRIPRKNIRSLGAHPLLAYSIAAARSSDVFARIVVSTEDAEIAAVARRYDAEVLIRPDELATDCSPDIEWVTHALVTLGEIGDGAFAILRPTSPFRTADTIRRAVDAWTRHGASVDSLRAVQRASQHPGKMWVPGPELCDRPAMEPLLSTYEWVERGMHPYGPPSHSRPTQALPTVYVQNASLEIAWCDTVTRLQSISGDTVLPFFTEGYEGFDLNHADDWLLAEALIERGLAQLPEVSA